MADEWRLGAARTILYKHRNLASRQARQTDSFAQLEFRILRTCRPRHWVQNQNNACPLARRLSREWWASRVRPQRQSVRSPRSPFLSKPCKCANSHFHLCAESPAPRPLSGDRRAFHNLVAPFCSVPAVSRLFARLNRFLLNQQVVAGRCLTRPA